MDEASIQEQLMRQEQVAANEERRIMILDQILEPAAKERMKRLALTRKEKARAVEDSLINAATNGRLGGKVTEEQLIQMLEQINGEDSTGGGSAGGGKGKVNIQRRKYGFDDEDDDDNDDDLM
jgi:programmed cell death protein 5